MWRPQLTGGPEPTDHYGHVKHPIPGVSDSPGIQRKEKHDHAQGAGA
jgi:hypothetical protein